MWTITSRDLAQAKERIKERRAEIEAKYGEALKSLDSDLAEIDAIERVAGGFAGKYAHEQLETAAERTLAESEEGVLAESGVLADSGGLADGNENGRGSRWRLHFSGARGEREESPAR